MATPNVATRAALYPRLLELHRSLLEKVRLEYEATHGEVGGKGELLQLVIHDEAFAWLRPLSRLLVEIDDPKLVRDDAAARALVERLFAPGNGFFDRYLHVVQAVPAIALEHAQVMRVIRALPKVEEPESGVAAPQT